MFNDYSQTYTEFKRNFYERFPDLSIFNCGDKLNLLKVVLSGLRVNYVSKGEIRAPLFWNFFFQFPFYLIKYLKSPKTRIAKDSKKKYLIYSTSRFVAIEGEKKQLYYYKNIIDFYGRENCLIVIDTEEDKSLYDYDYSIQEIKNSFYLNFVFLNNAPLKRDLKMTFKILEYSKKFKSYELQNIKIAFQLFFDEYVIFNEFIKLYENLQNCLLDGHYHREGLIFGLKENNVICIDTQHGLISKNDIFYVFPELIKEHTPKMLFPEKMFVWGLYWKEVLLNGFEFKEHQISVLGDYPYTNIELNSIEGFKRLKESAGKHKIVILICSQTSLHDYFKSYCLFLSNEIVKERIDAFIIFKPHPGESIEIYNDLKELKNVQLTRIDVRALFSFCNIQISAYSTTLVEGLRYNLKTFSLKIEICADYIEEFFKNGISKPLELNQTPFESLDTINSKKNDFFEPISYDILN